MIANPSIFKIIQTFNQSFIILHRNTGHMLHSTFPQRETEVYDDLSSFLHIFKRAITNTEHICLSIEAMHDCSSSLETLSEIISEIRCLSVKYDNDRLCQAIEAATFNRFIYRLIEIVANCKIKYQYIVNLPVEHSFDSFLKDIETFLSQSEKIRTFYQLVTFILKALLKFISKIATKYEDKIIGREDSEKFRDIVKKIGEEYQRVLMNERSSPSNGYSLNGLSQVDKGDNSVPQEKKGKIIIANQTFAEIHKRFDRFRGMDLDFIYFRGSYFEAKSNYDSFYKECFERNRFILGMITTYNSEFLAFSKRLQGKSNRKYKMQMANLTDQSKDEEELILDIDTNELDKSEDVASRSKGNSMIVPFAMDSSKVSDKIRNVYISLGKNHQKLNKNNLSSILIKKKTIQSNHLSFVSGATQKTTSQNDHNHPNHNNIRIKTEGKSQRLDKYSYSESKHKKVTIGESVGFMISPKKVELKMKYFELNCISSTVKAENARHRVLLNSKFSIKHADRSKLMQLFGQK